MGNCKCMLHALSRSIMFVRCVLCDIMWKTESKNVFVCVQFVPIRWRWLCLGLRVSCCCLLLLWCSPASTVADYLKVDQSKRRHAYRYDILTKINNKYKLRIILLSRCGLADVIRICRSHRATLSLRMTSMWRHLWCCCIAVVLNLFHC